MTKKSADKGTRHVPSASMHELGLLGFEEARKAAPVEPFDEQAWLYVPPFYTEYRYVLGTRGQRPLLCIGLNPSTASPARLDNTLQSVQRVALHNGFDSFLMMNLYAQRATKPGDMDAQASEYLHQQNLKAFEYLLGHARTVWAAWGAVITTRGYLQNIMRDFVALGQAAGAYWVTAGQKSRAGHPHHPLYLKKDSVFEPFDVLTYLAGLEAL